MNAETAPEGRPPHNIASESLPHRTAGGPESSAQVAGISITELIELVRPLPSEVPVQTGAGRQAVWKALDAASLSMASWNRLLFLLPPATRLRVFGALPARIQSAAWRKLGEQARSEWETA